MTISLSPELESFVNEKVSSGAYSSPDELVHTSLQLMQERDKLLEENRAQLRVDIQKGLDCFTRGEYTEYDTNTIGNLAEEIKTEGRRRKAEKVIQK